MSRFALLLGLAVVAALVALLLLFGGDPEPDLDRASGNGGISAPPAPPEDLPPPRFGDIRVEESGPGSTRPGTAGAGANEPPVVTDLESVRALIEAKEASAALRALNRMIESDPNDGEAIAVRGKLHLELGWFRQAERDLAAASRLNDEDPASLLTHAESLLRLRRSPEAEALVRRSLELQPDQARAHALLAVMLLREKRTEAARSEIREAIRLDPDEPLTSTLAGHVQNR